MLKNKYYKWYVKLITNAKKKKRKKTDKFYYENHHILPKCLFKQYKNDKWNLVLLTAREHFLAHWLLLKIFPSMEMELAFCLMNNRTLSSKSRHRIPSYLYERHKIKANDLMSNHFRKKFSKIDHHSKGLKNWSKDMRWINKNGKRKRVRSEEIDMYLNKGWNKGSGLQVSDYHKRRASEVHSNKIVSENTRKKQSISHLGQTNMTKGSVWIHKDNKRKRIEKSDLNFYLHKGWNRGSGMKHSRKKKSNSGE